MRGIEVITASIILHFYRTPSSQALAHTWRGTRKALSLKPSSRRVVAFQGVKSALSSLFSHHPIFSLHTKALKCGLWDKKGVFDHFVVSGKGRQNEPEQLQNLFRKRAFCIQSQDPHGKTNMSLFVGQH